MSKELPVLKPKQVVAALGKAGFEVRRQTGSHLIMYKSGSTVPFPYLSIRETFQREPSEL